MRLALAQLNLVIGDFGGAAAAVTQAALQAKAQRADVLLCPEMTAFGGYPPRDLVERRWLVERQWAAVVALARTLPLPTLIGCIEPISDGSGPMLANAMVLLDRGTIAHVYRKRLLPTYDVFDERRHFRPGTESPVIEIAGKRIGLTICEDIWTKEFAGIGYEVDPVAELTGRCDVLVNISASPYHVGKHRLRRRLVETVARRVGAPVAYCNLIGAHDELLFEGDSCIVDGGGRTFANAPRWREALVVGELGVTVPATPMSADVADLYEALVVGIRDYCAKTRQSRVVIGLSGGIDSALVAALAVDALGAKNVIGLLMPGPYSSAGSVTDAEALAQRLGIERHVLSINTSFSAALATLSPVFDKRAPDVAEENLQSRLRGTLVMAVANKLSAMALTTGNKSELACGYCTIYGDMNGGLAPIGDVYKTDVWRLARYANHRGERIPEASISKPPSAELRENQLDQDSLPPYEVLDRILKRYLEETVSVDDIVAAGEDRAVVSRIARLVETSEFKRRQAAPALRVSAKAFGVGRRIPIARNID